MQEHSNYFVDAEKAMETVRLIDQAEMTSRATCRQPFPASVKPDTLRTVLDLACGPGDWPMDVVFSHPDIEVVGVDISQTMVNYAQARAKSRGLYNVIFEVGDITKPLEYLDASFDYVNARYLGGYLRPAEWAALLAECRRILKPNGYICLNEGEWPLSTSPAYQRYARSISHALKLAGQSFSADGYDLALTPMLGKLLRDAGFSLLERTVHWQDLSYGTDEYMNWLAICRSLFAQTQPFLIKHLPVTQEELESLYQQALIEMQQPDFCAAGFSLSVLASQAAETGAQP